MRAGQAGQGRAGPQRGIRQAWPAACSSQARPSSLRHFVWLLTEPTPSPRSQGHCTGSVRVAHLAALVSLLIGLLEDGHGLGQHDDAQQRHERGAGRKTLIARQLRHAEQFPGHRAASPRRRRRRASSTRTPSAT